MIKQILGGIFIMLLFVGTRSLGGSNNSRPKEEKTLYIPLKPLVKGQQIIKGTFSVEEPKKEPAQKTISQALLGFFCCYDKKN